MRTPGFTGDVPLHMKEEMYRLSDERMVLGVVLPQFGFGFGRANGGITGPADPDGDWCYYCVQYVRVPC
jgi:hypothetical protein